MCVLCWSDVRTAHESDTKSPRLVKQKMAQVRVGKSDVCCGPALPSDRCVGNVLC